MNNKEVGQKIKSIRESQGISREQLAKKLNLSSYSIRNFEQGQRAINFKNLNKFAQALNVSLDDLVGNEYNKSKLELENALQNGADNTPNLISNFKDLTKKEVANNFNELVEVLDWNDFKNMSEDDIYSVVNSQELYDYLNFLFFKRLNKKK